MPIWKFEVFFEVIERTTPHHGLILFAMMKVGKRKKVGKWQREKVGCFTLGSLEAEAETGILVQAKGVREAR